MTEYEIKLSKGHVLIHDGEGWLLVDTGSPLSFHESGHINLAGVSRRVFRFFPGVDAAYVSDKVGERVGGLVGMDILGGVPVKIDLPAGKLTFGCTTEGMTRVPSKTILTGHVLVDMIVNGLPARLVLDTGAPISYVDTSFTEGLAPVGTGVDFMPGFSGDDTHETPIFEFPASFAGREFMMKAGHLPKEKQMEVSLVGASGAVGYELFSRFPIAIADGSVWA